MTAAFEKELVLAMFPSARTNVGTHFGVVSSALDGRQVFDWRLRLVAYATIRAESAGFRPIPEYESSYNTFRVPYEFGWSRDFSGFYAGDKRSAKVNLYEYRSDLGNNSFGDGERYKGRGFVQLTGRTNYAKYGAMIGEDLIQHPELANVPHIAAALLAAYIADHKDRIASAIDRQDFRSARKAVNGGSYGLSAFEQAYKTGAAWLRLEQNLDRIQAATRTA